MTFPVRKNKNDGTESQEEPLSVSKYLREFDIKDTIDFSEKNTAFKYDPSLENKLHFNLLNGFHKESTTTSKQ